MDTQSSFRMLAQRIRKCLQCCSSEQLSQHQLLAHQHFYKPPAHLFPYFKELFTITQSTKLSITPRSKISLRQSRHTRADHRPHRTSTIALTISPPFKATTTQQRPTYRSRLSRHLIRYHINCFLFTPLTQAGATSHLSGIQTLPCYHPIPYEDGNPDKS